MRPTSTTAHLHETPETLEDRGARWALPAPLYSAPHISVYGSCTVSHGRRSVWGYAALCTVCGEHEAAANVSSVTAEDAPGYFARKHADCAIAGDREAFAAASAFAHRANNARDRGPVWWHVFRGISAAGEPAWIAAPVERDSREILHGLRRVFELEPAPQYRIPAGDGWDASSISD